METTHHNQRSVVVHRFHQLLLQVHPQLLQHYCPFVLQLFTLSGHTHTHSFPRLSSTPSTEYQLMPSSLVACLLITMSHRTSVHSCSSFCFSPNIRNDITLHPGLDPWTHILLYHSLTSLMTQPLVTLEHWSSFLSPDVLPCIHSLGFYCIPSVHCPDLLSLLILDLIFSHAFLSFPHVSSAHPQGIYSS